MLNWDDYSEDHDEPKELADAVEKTPSVGAVPDNKVTPPQGKLLPAVDAFLEVDINAEELAEGLADLEMMGARVCAADKRMINGNSDINQVVPLKYDWAWQKYLDGCNNHWTPQEVNMTDDIALWKSEDGLTPDERRIVEMALGYFSTADTVVANNLLLGVYKHITAPEARFYIGLQFREELTHAHAYQYCIESMSMDENRIWNMYREQPSVARKAAWSLKHSKALSDPAFCTGTPEADREFLKNLIAYYVVAEGIFFYCGFSSVLQMGRMNKLTGVAEQFQYILRDESMHLNFGVDLINQIKIENPDLWDEQMKFEATRLIAEGVMLEIESARDVMPRGVLGMNAPMMEEYLKFIANRRVAQLDLPEMFSGVTNPFPWMSEIMDLRKEKNFFETRVIEYQAGAGLSWD